jgi:hypothetical protein
MALFRTRQQPEAGIDGGCVVVMSPAQRRRTELWRGAQSVSWRDGIDK